MADVVRCSETISNYVLDAGEAISYRSLASQVGGASATRAKALTQFLQDNQTGVGVIRVTVERASGAKKGDPRARVIRISTALPAEDAASVVYGVFPSAQADAENDTSMHEAMTLAMWAQERKIRNELFGAVSKNKPLPRELQAFYDSDIQCPEATPRDLGSANRGEEAVSMFDSIKATSTGRQAAATPSSFFKSSGSTKSATTSTASSTSASKGNSSFFGSSTNSKSRPSSSTNSSASKSKAPAPAETRKRIDADAMSNVLTVDSDSDSDSDDSSAPKFVKSAPAIKSRTKRVMISDDEDEDDEAEVVAAPAKKKAAVSPPAARPSIKRKLSESSESVANKKASSPKQTESPKRKCDMEDTPDDEPQDEDDTLPTGPIKRKRLVTTTRINDDGYMVTEKTYEEVEVSVEELAKERAEGKKQAAIKAAADAQKARAAAAAAAANSKASKSAGPAKQKKLDFFFTRK